MRSSEPPVLMIQQLVSTPVERTYAPEESPYSSIIIDVTHRCNMACRNCYLPNRVIPDLDARWLSGIFARLPRGTFVRLVGAEPTLREDLPDLIRDVRAHGHVPVIVTNGLKLADRAYVRILKEAGVRVISLSLNGVFDDDLYEAIDQMRCAARKRAAFENLRAERIYSVASMILVRGVNEHALPELIAAARRSPNVRELHVRSIGAMGRHMEDVSFTLDELFAEFVAAAGLDASAIARQELTETSHDFIFGKLRVQLTVWPDLNSRMRGRLTPEGMIAPFMEHVIANEGGY
jgi:molybdenum cofactor biosynthesis enzyme MoaA